MDHFDFMPHGMCYLWRPDLLALHVISDGLIALAYFSIPFTLLYFVRQRRDLEFNWMFVCFAAFIIACGATHVLEVVTVWTPVYWLSGTVKAITALASVPTAILLARLIPQAVAMPTQASLRREVEERQRAELEVRRVNEQLEARVAERTAELEAMNVRLRAEATQREEAESARLASARLLEAVVDNSPAVIYVKQADGRYLLTNRRYEEVFGVARGAMLGRTDHDLFERAGADAYRAMDQRAIEAGTPISEREVATLADGTHTYISVKAPLRDPAGAVYGIIGVSTDITKQVENEKRLESQLAHLRLLDETTQAIGERQDLRSIFQTVLGKVEEHLSIDLACICMRDAADAVSLSAVGRRSFELANRIDLREHHVIPACEQLRRCLDGELVVEADLAGSAQPLHEKLLRVGMRTLACVPLIVESRTIGALLCARSSPGSLGTDDVEFLRQLSAHVALAAHQAQLYDSLQRAYEDLRQTQQSVLQQERLRALGQMASGIAHDINNALSPAAIYVQTMSERETGLTPAARERLAIVQRSLEDVANTVSRMREFYRPREAQLEHAPIDAGRLIHQVVELTRARWSDIPQERGIVIRLREQVESDLPAILGADNEIRDAVTNLVLNAVDAMPEGGDLTLRAFRDADPRRVGLEIIDTGLGMSEEVRARCLEPFFTTKGERGTGLGLAMVYGMARRHDAELQIESAPGKGTTIRLLFPVAATGTTSGTETAAAPQRRLRLLIVDDDPMLLRSVRDALELDGHTVEAAAGGQAGIDAFAAARAGGAPPDLVLTDLGMPNVDGRKVAAAIKQMSPTTPVVLLTGWGHRLQATREVPAHVDRVISKPPKLGELRQALRDLA